MTNIHVVIDRSGSMQKIKDDAIGGFNQFLKETGGKENQRWWVWLFDSQGIDLIEDSVRAEKVQELTDKTFVPRGCTPLYDAVGRAMAKAREEAADKNVFVVLTDGQENDSKEWTKESVTKELDAVAGDDWQLVFIAAGKEAWSETELFKNRGVTVQSSLTGPSTRGGYGAASIAVMDYCAADGVAPVITSVIVDDDGKVTTDAADED